jgi:large subunit ribosomal protein L35
MAKNKTHSGAKKRFKVTGSGKIMRLQAGRKSGAAFASATTTGSR